jgi:hypothetical protein
MKCVFCGPVKNCDPFLDKVFSNIEKMGTLFENYVIILFYDHLVTFDGLPTKKKLEMLSLEGGFPSKLHSFVNDLKQVAREARHLFQ